MESCFNIDSHIRIIIFTYALKKANFLFIFCLYFVSGSLFYFKKLSKNSYLYPTHITNTISTMTYEDTTHRLISQVILIKTQVLINIHNIRSQLPKASLSQFLKHWLTFFHLIIKWKHSAEIMPSYKHKGHMYLYHKHGNQASVALTLSLKY